MQIGNLSTAPDFFYAGTDVNLDIYSAVLRH
jgi:hypothetical protein